MAESVRERVRRHRQMARGHGLVRVEVELPGSLLALRGSDETVKSLLIRALTALPRKSLPETKPSRYVPDDFPRKPTPGMREWAEREAPHVDIDIEHGIFLRMHFKRAHGNWPKTWENWMLRTEREWLDAHRTPEAMTRQQPPEL